MKRVKRVERRELLLAVLERRFNTSTIDDEPEIE